MLGTDINFPGEKKEILQEIVIMPEQVIKNNGWNYTRKEYKENSIVSSQVCFMCFTGEIIDLKSNKKSKRRNAG